MFRWVRYLWASPTTVAGLAVALLAGGRIAVRDGVVEAHGGRLRWLLRGGAAATLGHVILARDAACLERSRAHERVHVRQFERWGPFLLPVAWLIGRWLAWRGYDPYLDHPFEREASGQS